MKSISEYAGIFDVLQIADKKVTLPCGNQAVVVETHNEFDQHEGVLLYVPGVTFKQMRKSYGY